MWLFRKNSETPDFGFHVEVVQLLKNGNTVYAGYGFRVVELKAEGGKSLYQLRVKDKVLLEWGLSGTFQRSSEVRRKVVELAVETRQKSFFLKKTELNNFALNGW